MRKNVVQQTVYKFCNYTCVERKFNAIANVEMQKKIKENMHNEIRINFEGPAQGILSLL